MQKTYSIWNTITIGESIELDDAETARLVAINQSLSCNAVILIGPSGETALFRNGEEYVKKTNVYGGSYYGDMISFDVIDGKITASTVIKDIFEAARRWATSGTENAATNIQLATTDPYIILEEIRNEKLSTNPSFVGFLDFIYCEHYDAELVEFNLD